MKFAKLLPEEGWTPIVVTPSNPDHPVTDASLSQEVDDVETWRFPIWEPSRTLRAWGVGGQMRLGAERRGQGSWSSRLAKWVRGNLFVPDARVTWVKPTTKALVRKLREQPVDLVITTGPPHSMHLVGLDLKRALGVPWIADLRDPWSDMDYLDTFAISQKVRARIRAMEQEVVQHADQVLVTSPGALDTLQPTGGKGVVLTNGWDQEDFAEGPKTDRIESSTKALGHFGALYGARNAPALWRALGDVSGQWTLRLGGQVADEVREDLARAGAGVQFLGDMPHRESVQAMRQCDALLVIHNNSDSAKRSTPGKMFECLASGLPVLVVGPGDSDLAALCEAWRFAFVAHGDPNLQAKASQFLADLPAEGARPELVTAFERRALTAQLARLMDGCVKH